MSCVTCGAGVAGAMSNLKGPNQMYLVSIKYRGVYTSSVPFLGAYMFARGDSAQIDVRHAAQLLYSPGQTPDVPAEDPTHGRPFVLTDRADFDRMMADGHIVAGTDPAQFVEGGAAEAPASAADEAKATESDEEKAPVKTRAKKAK